MTIGLEEREQQRQARPTGAPRGLSSAGAPVGVCLFGAPPDTRNLGVTALCHSAVGGLARRLPGAAITVFDFGKGVRRGAMDLGSSRVACTRIGSSMSRRYYRRDNVWNMRVSGWLGGLGNPGVAAIRGSNAVLDVTGGDSFTDLYGPKRFRGGVLRKRVALEQGARLILLPQTYGPFQRSEARREASEVARRATMAWARDERSFEILVDLLGDAFDERRHRCGVDLAFGLEAVRPRGGVPAWLEEWLATPELGPVIGFNVSGLVMNDAEEARRRYGFKADYRSAVLQILRWLVEGEGCRVVLLPHVLEPAGHHESDPAACAEVARELGASGRVMVLPASFDCAEMKWIVGKLEWFCGTRMHSTIAGLSSGVSTAAIAYSDKTAGVFGTCGVGDSVADPRSLETAGVVEAIRGSWKSRHERGTRLRAALPGVLAKAAEQMDRIAEACAAGAPGAPGVGGPTD